MARFINKVDAKGRIFIPAKVRDQIGSPVFVTMSQDPGYLMVYAKERFEHIVEQFAKIPMTDPKIRHARRQIVGEALECDLDGQGRISVSSELWSRISANPSEEVCIYQTDKDALEICTKKFYDEENADPENQRIDIEGYGITGL
ncbi:MAG: hypothetical protein IKG93_05210 [Clostridiales bacterium]|nr:hypothetical protein [Clostridiales bacterium]